MIQNKKILIGAVTVFSAVEATLGYLLQTASGELVPWLCFSSVVFACLFCVAFAERSYAYLLTQLALVCTVCADFFLLITPVRHQLPAMLFFSVTQLSYFLRLYLCDESKKRRAWHVGIRSAISIVAVAATLMILGPSADAVAVVSMFYYANLITNIVFAFIQFEKPGLFAIGLLLFAMCDALIGFAFLDGYLPIPADSFIYKIIHPGFDLAWAFYLPSQTLLAISLLPRRITKEQGS
jgi:hypothetical protein